MNDHTFTGDTITVPLYAGLGEWWSATITVSAPASWVGWTGRAEVRHYPGSPTVLVELDVDLGTDGVAVVSVPTGATADLPPLTGVWDLRVGPAGVDPQWIATGPVELLARVTAITA